MLSETPTIEQLTQVIASVTAPAFLLGAVAGFISVLISRLNRVLDRSQALNAIENVDDPRSRLKADIPRLKRRAVLLNNAILFATVCAIITSLLIIVAFASAFFRLQHEYGIAVLFIIALAFFVLSVVNLARETRIGLHEFDHYK